MRHAKPAEKKKPAIFGRPDPEQKTPVDARATLKKAIARNALHATSPEEAGEEGYSKLHDYLQEALDALDAEEEGKEDDAKEAA